MAGEIQAAFDAVYSDGPSSNPDQPSKDRIRGELAPVIQGQVDEIRSLASTALQWKEPVRVASTANIDVATGLENGAAIDGVTLATGDRVLLKNQTAGSQNGVYIVPTSGTASRASDADEAAELVGLAVFVRSGATNGGKQFACSTPAPITAGATPLTFQEISDQSALNANLAGKADQSELVALETTVAVPVQTISRHLDQPLAKVTDGDGETHLEVMAGGLIRSLFLDFATGSGQFELTDGDGALLLRLSEALGLEIAKLYAHQAITIDGVEIRAYHNDLAPIVIHDEMGWVVAALVAGVGWVTGEGEEIGSVTDVFPHFGTALLIADERPQTIYYDNLFAARRNARDVEISIIPTSPPAAATAVQRRALGDLRIEGEDISGNDAALSVRPVGSETSARLPLKVRKASLAGAGAARSVHILGDSISNRQVGKFVADDLAAWNYSASFVGTVSGSADPDDRFNAGGVLGEAREGWSFDDYIHFLLDRSQPIPVSDEALYLGYSKTAKMNWNPYIRAATGGDDPSIVYNGYVWDFGFYRSRFSLASPSHLVIGLGTNDMMAPGDNAAQAATRALNVMLPSIRADSPTTSIGLWLPPRPRTAASDEYWEERAMPCFRAIYQAVAALADPLIDVLPVHACASPDDFAPTVSSTDAATGSQVITVGDVIHPTGISRRQIAEQIALWVAATA